MNSQAKTKETKNTLPSGWKKQDIEKRLRCTLEILIRNDQALFKSKANERSLTHMFALYLAKQFPEYNVDCEYNRMWQDGIEQEKRIIISGIPEMVSAEDTEATTVFPDIIVHRRENSDNNLLVIETKKSSNNNRRMDFRKLNSFMNGIDAGGRGYEFSAFVIFNVENPEKSTVEVKNKNETWNI
jgi:hypothetical protein